MQTLAIGSPRKSNANISPCSCNQLCIVLLLTKRCQRSFPHKAIGQVLVRVRAVEVGICPADWGLRIKADGGDQQKFDDGMRAIRKKGIQVWPSPDVMEKMGAKDALVKVANMNIGLEETRMRGFVSSGATPRLRATRLMQAMFNVLLN